MLGLEVRLSLLLEGGEYGGGFSSAIFLYLLLTEWAVCLAGGVLLF